MKDKEAIVSPLGKVYLLSVHECVEYLIVKLNFTSTVLCLATVYTSQFWETNECQCILKKGFEFLDCPLTELSLVVNIWVERMKSVAK